jgi:hypothetical protein
LKSYIETYFLINKIHTNMKKLFLMVAFAGFAMAASAQTEPTASSTNTNNSTKKENCVKGEKACCAKMAKACTSEEKAQTTAQATKPAEKADVKKVKATSGGQK